MKLHFLLVLTLLTFAACSKKTDKEVMSKAVDAHKQDHFEEALEVYQRVVDEFPTSPRVPEALYAMGNIEHDRKKNSRRAVELFRKLVSSFPDHATASNALFLTGFIYNNELKSYDSAKIAYEEFIRKYPSDNLVQDARFELEHLGMDPAEIIKDKIDRDEKANPRNQATKK